LFDTFNGLPVHPLVVHAVVVLLPLAVVGTLALVARPAWRARYGLLLLLVTAVGTAFIPVATQSGEALERQVGDPGSHAALGDQLIWFALPLLVCVALLLWFDRRRSVTGTRVLAALCAVAAVATGVQVYRVGDSGARAAWGNRVSSSTGDSSGIRSSNRPPGPG
jgi:uncharacterized membrane protein